MLEMKIVSILPNAPPKFLLPTAVVPSLYLVCAHITRSRSKPNGFLVASSTSLQACLGCWYWKVCLAYAYVWGLQTEYVHYSTVHYMKTPGIKI